MEETSSVVVQVPGLKGTRGHLLLDVAGATAGVLDVQEGQVELIPSTEVGTSDVDGILHCADRDDAVRLLRGEVNPVVAALQGRLWIDGDVALCVRVILELNAAMRARTGAAAGASASEE